MTILGNLPDEVIVEIVSRIPSDSLLRFKSVSKSWYALINDPEFIAENFSNSLEHEHEHKHKHVLLKRLVKDESGKLEYAFSILKFPLAPDRSASLLDFGLPFDEDVPYLEISGHSHGFVCLSVLHRDIFLCNPTTREFRKLPPSMLLLTEPESDDDYDFYSMMDAVGFGYAAKSRDFKVVRVVNFVDGGGQFYPPRVEIYSFREDRWREIETPVGDRVFWAPSFEMCREGTCYWWANSEENVDIILSFDMSEEVFGEILVPESFEDSENYRSLGVLNASIVLFDYPCAGDEKSFDIWEMEKGESGAVSWSKLFTIGPLSGIEKPLLFVSSDELLMEANPGLLILYNIITQRFQRLPIEGEQHTFQATSFLGSLLSLKEEKK